MEAMLNAVRGEAERVAAQAAKPRLATVVSYDPAAYAVKVLVQPEGRETGWIPVSAPWSGNGWGLFAPPSPGDQVQLSHTEAGVETAICGGRLYSDEDRPDVAGIGGCPSGELWVVHQSGTRFRLLNDTSLELRHQSESRVRLLQDSTIEARHRDGSVMRFLPDSSWETIHKDGSRVRIGPDGAIEAVHSGGSYWRIGADGAIQLRQANGTRVTMHAGGGLVEIRAPQIQAAAEGAAAVRLVHEAFVTLFNSHTHPSGSGVTGVPVQQMNASYDTASLLGR